MLAERIRIFYLSVMSVLEIKDKLAALSRSEQDEVVAYLFHLRHADDTEYKPRSPETGRQESGHGFPQNN